MNVNTKIMTIVMSLSCVIGITLITNYVVTQIPNTIKSSIDVLSTPVEVNAFDARGITPLMQAAIDSDFERAKILLSQGANPNIRSASSDKDYALNYAIFNGGKLGSLAVAELLIANGAHVNLSNARGMAPIHFMMQITNADNRWKILNDLIEYGANINAQNEDGSTMLHITVTNWDNGWIDRINQVYGQIINYDIRDKRGRTPLDLAIELGHVSVNDAESVENSLRKRPTYIGDNRDVKAVDKFGRNGLQLATLRSDMRFVSELAKAGTNLGHQDDKGNTALHYAMINSDPEKFVRYLLQEKAPTNILNNAGESPLFWVTRIVSPVTRLLVAKALIDAGSPVANKNKEGKTALDVARAAGDQQLAELLRNTLMQRKKASQERIEKQKYMPDYPKPAPTGNIEVRDIATPAA